MYSCTHAGCLRSREPFSNAFSQYFWSPVLHTDELNLTHLQARRLLVRSFVNNARTNRSSGVPQERSPEMLLPPIFSSDRPNLGCFTVNDYVTISSRISRIRGATHPKSFCGTKDERQHPPLEKTGFRLLPITPMRKKIGECVLQITDLHVIPIPPKLGLPGQTDSLLKSTRLLCTRGNLATPQNNLFPSVFEAPEERNASIGVARPSRGIFPGFLRRD